MERRVALVLESAALEETDEIADPLAEHAQRQAQLVNGVLSAVHVEDHGAISQLWTIIPP